MADRDPMRVLGGKPATRTEWAGTGSSRPPASGDPSRRPAGRTTTDRRK